MTEPTASHRDVGQRALAWLRRSLECFDPFTYPAGDRMGRLAARKALVELAGLLLYRRRTTVDAPRNDDGAADIAYTAMVDGLADIAARRPYRDLIARQHRSLWMYGLPYAALRAWGREDPELRWMVEQAVAARYPVTWERLPYRYLDYLRFLDAGAIPHALAPAGDVFPLTLLHAEPSVAELEEDDVYAITHGVFYMTDYGLAAEPWPRGFDVDSAADLIEALLAQHAAEEHTDLTAELLICTASMGISGGDAVDAGWRLLSTSQSPGGAIAAPDRLIARSYSGERDDALYREWKRCYHTTLMTAMASLCAERAGAATARQPRGRSHSQRAVSAVGDALRRGLAWLDAEAQRSESWEALLAAAGAGIAAHVSTATAPTSAVDANEQPALHLAFTNLAARTEHVVAAADLLTLLAATPGMRARSRDVIDKLLARLPAGAAHRAERSTAMDGATALGLYRAAMHGDAGYSQCGIWKVQAVRAVRDYRLGDAAVLVMVLIIAGHESGRIVRDVVEALLAQQRFDGSFGYAAADVEDDAVASLRVSWTARAVCALAAYLQPESARRLIAMTAGAASPARS